MTKLVTLALAIDADSFAVLSAHVQNGADRREIIVDAAGVAANFGDIFVGKGDQYPTVAGGDDIVQVFDFQPGTFERFGDRHFGSDDAFRAGIANVGGQYFAVFKHDALDEPVNRYRFNRANSNSKFR